MKTFAFTLLVALLPLAAQAAGSASSEIERDMRAARAEMRADMAQARAELDTENLTLGDSLHVGRGANRKAAAGRKSPAAEITPRGDFLVDGKAVAIDARQRQLLLDYRGQVIAVAKIGIDGGERAAAAALEAVDVSMFSLIVGGLTGSLERRVEASTKRHIEPFVAQICRRMPQVLDAQRRLADGLPEFRPYATLEGEDVEDCEGGIRNDLATY